MKKFIAIAVCACALGLNGFAADTPAGDTPAKCDQNCPKACKDCKGCKDCKKAKKCDKAKKGDKKGECPKKAEA